MTVYNSCRFCLESIKNLKMVLTDSMKKSKRMKTSEFYVMRYPINETFDV